LLDITSDKQREFLFDMQMKDVESIARELMSNAGTIREEFTTAKHLEHVRPMFQVNQKRINIKKNFFFCF
jgi:brefeldin A-inhibited guanine nucleotide-exchange protein